MKKTFLFMFIAWQALYVNTPPTVFAGPAKSIKPKAKSKALTYQELIDKVVREGGDYTIKSGLGKELGFDIPVESKFIETPPAESKDGLIRVVFVVMNKPADESAPKPEWLIFEFQKQEKTKKQATYFKTTLDGILKLAALTTVIYDENGKPTGGGREQLDINSDEVKQKLAREKDFWLKGVGRKEADAKAGNVMYYEDGMKAAQEAYQRVQALTAKPALFAWDTPAALAQLPPAGR